MKTQKDESRSNTIRKNQPNRPTKEESLTPLAALEKLGNVVPPQLTGVDRRAGIREFYHDVTRRGGVWSDADIAYPAFLTHGKQYTKPRMSLLVRQLSVLHYNQLSIARYAYEARARESFLSEAGVMRSKSGSEVKKHASGLHYVLRQSVAAGCLVRATKNLNPQANPLSQVDALVERLGFPKNATDFQNGPTNVVDPMRHEFLCEFLKNQPYRLLAEKLREFFWSVSQNMALAFHEALNRGVEENIFGVAKFDTETRAARFHYFEQTKEASRGWRCIRHDHELINARRFPYDDAKQHQFYVPGFVQGVATAVDWIQPLFSIIDGELIHKHRQEIQPPPREEGPVSRLRALINERQRDNPPGELEYPEDDIFLSQWDPALVLPEGFVLVAWDAKSMREHDRLVPSPTRAEKLLDWFKAKFLQVPAAFLFLAITLSFPTLLTLAALIALGHAGEQPPVRHSTLLYWSYPAFLFSYVSFRFLSWTVYTPSRSKVSRVAQLLRKWGIGGDVR